MYPGIVVARQWESQGVWGAEGKSSTSPVKILFGIGDLGNPLLWSRECPCLTLLHLVIGPKYLVTPRPGFEVGVEVLFCLFVPSEGPQGFLAAALEKAAAPPPLHPALEPHDCVLLAGYQGQPL